MQPKSLESAGVLRGDHFVIAGVGIDDATAARRHVGKTILVKGLEEHQDGAWLGRTRVDELFAAAKLTGRTIVLHAGHDHWTDRPGQRGARRFGNHAGPQDLSLDLAEPRLQATLARPLRK